MRHELAIFVALLSCASCLHAQEDPAYVDSPANRAWPDPARADGGGKNPGRTRAYAFEAHPSLQQVAAAEAAQQEALAQIERVTAAYAEAAQRGQQQGMAAAREQQQQFGAYADAPIGGRDLLDAVRGDSDLAYGPPIEQPIMIAPAPTASGGEASARRQIGSGLLQDAAGAFDARTRRELHGSALHGSALHGSAGPVYLPDAANGY